MLSSLQETAPVTLNMRVNAGALLRLRKRLRANARPAPAYTDLLACLSARVLQRHPLLAGRWEDDRIVVPFEDGFHIGIAVDTEEGLLVPVLRDVLHQSPVELARKSHDLIQRARQGKATATELEGGVFTISSLGSFEIDSFTPIINWPETSILGVGAIRREPIVGDNDRIEIGDLMTLSLTFDHRVVDGAPAARFLADLRDAIESCDSQF
jgi:pyruvate dehydrogenase E2 component (dihydrolipoamide acetyltransferase)